MRQSGGSGGGSGGGSVDWLARTRAATAAMRAGRHAEAIDGFREIARANPRMPDAHNNLAVALRAAGDLEAAVAAYRRAVKIDGRYLAGHRNLARALRQIGKADDALTHITTARRLATASREAADVIDEIEGELRETVAGCRFDKPSAIGRAILEELFARDDVELARFGAAAVRLLATDRRLGAIFARATDLLRRDEDDPTFEPRPPNDPLFIRLLTGTVVAAPEIEAWITLVRRRLLERAADGQATGWPFQALAAVAAQMEMTEFCYRETEAERRTIDALLPTLSPERPDAILVAALYRPLSEIPHEESLRTFAPNEPDGALARLIERSLENPAAEARIAETLPVLDLSDDATSAAVRAQYEDNPYPRWLSLDAEFQGKPRRFAERHADRLAGGDTSRLDLDRPRILVAGCGTGRHAISTARRDPGASLLAVDLSRRSLAYAARRAAELGVDHIRFAQADILGLAGLEERFELIECSGVLHHMADPMAGWRVLRGLLKPGGLMRIGLYSRIGRARFERFRAPPPVGDDRATVLSAIRDRRAEVHALDPDDPAAALRLIGDFYSASGCRDLLFHAREVTVTIPEIGQSLAALNLDFLGFERLPETTMSAFRRTNPGVAETDLAAWDTFERMNPDTFIAMYQFWCRARN